jgi:hypothetical protein
MTQRTRYFLVGSALVIVIGLCTGLVAYYNGELPIRASSIGPAELAYVPAETSAIAFADVRQIMNSPFHQRLQQLMPAGQGRAEFEAATGINLDRDIDTVLAAMPSSASPATSPVVFVRGRFDAAKLEALAVQHGARAQDYQGRRLLVAPDAAAAQPAGTQMTPSSPAPPALQTPRQPSIMFLEPGLIALGELTALERCVDVAGAHRDITGNPDLMKFLAGVQGSGNAWIVGQFEAVKNNPMVPAEVKSQLPPVQWFAASAQVDRAVHGEVRAEALDDASGQQLRNVVNGALSAARLMGGQDPRVISVLDSLQTTGAGKDVAISFTVPMSVLDLIPASATARTQPAAH